MGSRKSMSLAKVSIMNALERYLTETLGISQLIVTAEFLTSSDSSVLQRPEAEVHTDHTVPLPTVEGFESAKSVLAGEDFSSFKVLVITQIVDPKHRVLLEKILAASGIKWEWAYIANIDQAESIMQLRTFDQTLVLGDFEEFRDQKEGEQRLRKGLGLTLKTFSLSQLEMSVEMKKLAWASLQIWMRQLKLDQR